jgi:putative SbcD/Mre11-related phosphoesterase
MRVFQEWLLTPERAAIHLPSATAVIADPHLGYDEVRRRGGEALPMFDLDEALARLDTLVARRQVQRLIIAGDLVEGVQGSNVAETFLQRLNEVGLLLVGVVPGNHDRRWLTGPSPFPVHERGIRLGNWRVVHGDGPLPRGPFVQGHEHPCIRLAMGLAAPCFLIGSRRLVLPAFSVDAAGVNVLGDRRWRNFQCGAIAGAEVLNLGQVGRLQKSKVIEA